MADAPYDGVPPEALRARLDLPRVEVWDTITSTLDAAHALAAAGAPAGTLVLAERQTAGRGRGGRRWASASGSGIWLTLIERPTEPGAVELLSIRLGLHAARVLDRFAPDVVRLKWPNDLYCGGGKLAGILVESRWRNARIDWVAVGFGLNVRAPVEIPGAAALRAGTSRLEVLAELVPALRAAAAARGALTDAEALAWHERDLARGRAVREPVPGVVQGIDANGALVVRTPWGDATCRSGSLIFEEDA